MAKIATAHNRPRILKFRRAISDSGLDRVVYGRSVAILARRGRVVCVAEVLFVVESGAPGSRARVLVRLAFDLGGDVVPDA